MIPVSKGKWFWLHNNVMLLPPSHSELEVFADFISSSPHDILIGVGPGFNFFFHIFFSRWRLQEICRWRQDLEPNKANITWGCSSLTYYLGKAQLYLLYCTPFSQCETECEWTSEASTNLNWCATLNVKKPSIVGRLFAWLRCSEYGSLTIHISLHLKSTIILNFICGILLVVKTRF